MYGKLSLCFILISLLCLICTQVNAQDHFNVAAINQFYHNWMDGVYDVAVAGNHAFLACGSEGMHVVDMSRQDAPQDVGHLAYQWAEAIAVSGEYAYIGGYSDVVGRDHAVVVADVSDPASPQEITRVSVNGYVNAVRIIGNRAFICADGLIVLDISDPTQPQLIWRSEDINETRAIEIRGDTAYVAALYDGLQVFDISNISAPTRLAQWVTGTGNWVNGVDVSRGYAYLACGWDGFRVIDLATMQMVAGIDSLAYGFGIKVVDTHAYINYGDPECPLAVVDISNPLSPETMGIYHPLAGYCPLRACG